MREYVIEFYSRERIRELSEKGLIHQEFKRRIDELLRLRRDHPEGSNQECMCMDMITELISKLDLEDFRTLKIEQELVTKAGDICCCNTRPPHRVLAELRREDESPLFSCGILRGSLRAK